MNTSLAHFHVTFTLPGAVTKSLFEKGFECEEMITVASRTYWKELQKSAGRAGKEWRCRSIATLHTCGNSLNFNPHIHLIGTRELVNTETGELFTTSFINYTRMRFSWINDACTLFRKQGIFNDEELRALKERYKNGFHVFFQPVTGNQNDVLFRTAEYLAAGYFHNSMVTKLNHENKKVTFRYKSWVDRTTKEKTFSEMTMDIYEFMARMLYYLPDRHKKMVRYYGIYAHQIGEKLDRMKRKAWAKAIESSFDTNPELCPDCGTPMRESSVFSFEADRAWKKLWKTHMLYQGYFRMRRGP